MAFAASIGVPTFTCTQEPLITFWSFGPSIADLLLVDLPPARKTTHVDVVFQVVLPNPNYN